MSTEMISLPRYRFVQSAWIVKDVETAALRWSETCGVGPLVVFDNPQFDELTYRGAPAKIVMRGAVAQSGDMQIELIEQRSSDRSAYRDLIPAGSEGFHHMAAHAADFDAELAHFQRTGASVATQGRFGALRFAYLDTVGTLGFMIELLDVDPATKATYAAIAKLAEIWDGARPLRSSSELAH